MNDSSIFEYVVHENGIHEFILKQSSMVAAYAYLEIIEPIYAARNSSSPPLRVIINSTGDGLPLSNSLLRHVRNLLNKYPNMGRTYTAILTTDTLAIRLAGAFLRMLRFPGLQARFFDHTRREAAVQWLLEQK